MNIWELIIDKNDGLLHINKYIKLYCIYTSENSRIPFTYLQGTKKPFLNLIQTFFHNWWYFKRPQHINIEYFITKKIKQKLSKNLNAAKWEMLQVLLKIYDIKEFKNFLKNDNIIQKYVFAIITDLSHFDGFPVSKIKLLTDIPKTLFTFKS